MRRVIWSAAADADLRGAEAWLAANRPPKVELRTLERIHERCDFLVPFPHGGPTLSGEQRKLLVTGTPYLLIYRRSDTDIEILRLFHESEDWQTKL